MLRISTPDGSDRVLLHACCAPCSSAIIETMLANNITPVIYFYNPNIYPEEEYIKRKQEIETYAQKLGLEIVDADYDYTLWKSGTCGMETLPEL